MSDRAPLLRIPEAELAMLMVSNLNSIALDFAARTSVGGTDLSYFIIKQLPILHPNAFWETLYVSLPPARFIVLRALELVYTAWDLKPLALDCGYDGPPFKWDEGRRFTIRCEMDALFFHLYLGSDDEWKQNGPKELLAYFPTPRHAVEYIMETFPIVKRKDEAAHGHYRTKDTILEIYDEITRVSTENAAAVAAGRQPTARYQTRLNPPPGPPMDAEGNFIPVAQWEYLDPHSISHIHPPKI